ncbi:MAG: His/Gly/Thr/Pro-type tRNA ligase C-terminal domain-containing protein, partial [Methylomonas sp.]
PITAEAFRGRIIADYSVESLSDFVCGANEAGFHYTGVNWGRDWNLAEESFCAIRQIVAGDPSPDGQGEITIARGIEVGHIFQLGTKYSESMNASIVNEAGKNQIMIMGCYGIGISRVVAAAIEQGHDERGIIWPNELAPFQVAICPMNMYKSDRLVDAVEKVYQDLLAAGIEVLLDDRKVRAGFMFSDMELIGIPHRIVIGDRGLDSGTVEYQGRTNKESQDVAFADIVSFIKGKLA